MGLHSYKRELRKWSKLLPRAVAVLGELGNCACEYPDGSGRVYGMDYVHGRVLCATDDGRQMFIIKPISDAGRVRISSQMLRAFGMHERFVHRKADSYFNCIVPQVQPPKLAGYMMVITYFQDKGDLGEAEFHHYFDKPGDAPAYAPFYAIGSDQYWFPRGPWKADYDGIEYADE